MSQLGLGLNLSKTKGGVVPFNPLSLDPYLLFDTQSSMIGTLENPTLDLDPSKPDTLNVITATRAGVATYTDADGLIQSASADTVRVDYVQGEELTPTVYQRVGYTDFSNTTYPLGWQSSGTTLVEGNGYEGQPSVIFTAEGSYQYVACGVPTTAGVTYTGSIWVRRIAGNEPLVVQHSSSATGTNSGNLSVTTEWTKVEVQFLGRASSGNVFFGIKVQSASAAGTSFEIAMPQVEEGTTASSFVANTTGSPKFITGATYGSRVPMILVEPSATNLLPYSEHFGSGWSVDDVSLTGGNPSPDGSDAATLLKGNTNASRHNVVRFGVTNTVTGSFSLFAKAKELRYLQIASANTASQYANFDLLSGTIGSVASDFSNAKLESYPDGWYRITLVSPNKYNNYYISLVSGLTAVWLESWAMPNDTDGLYIWGAQLEESSVATSYIPTSGSTVTRAADDLVISGSDFTNFYNQSEGTVYAETLGRELDFNYVFTISDGTSSNRLVAIHHNFNHIYIQNSGVIQAALDGGTFTAGTLCRYAASFKENDVRVSIDGGAEVTDTTATIPTSTKLNVGSRENGSENLNGHIKRLIYWPYHSDSL